MRENIFCQMSRVTCEAVEHMGEEILMNELLESFVHSHKDSIKKLITTTKTEHCSTYDTTFRMELVIMSVEEYRELKGIEKMYDEMVKWRL